MSAMLRRASEHCVHILSSALQAELLLASERCAWLTCMVRSAACSLLRAQGAGNSKREGVYEWARSTKVGCALNVSRSTVHVM